MDAVRKKLEEKVTTIIASSHSASLRASSWVDACYDSRTTAHSRAQSNQLEMSTHKATKSDNVSVNVLPPLCTASTPSLNASRPPSMRHTISSDSQGNQSEERIHYVLSNLNSIPDVRDQRIHVGLPLPDNELESLLSLVRVAMCSDV